MVRFLYTLLFIAILFQSCESEITPDTNTLGWQYFPLEVGRFHEYEVQDIEVAPNWANDTVRFELRTELVDKFDNGAGTESFVMHRFTRQIGATEWEFESSWVVRRDFGRLVVYEENTPYIKLSFPTEDGREWDGNALNTNGLDTYEMELPDPVQNRPDAFETTTLRVIQEDLFDLIIGEEDRRTEHYGENVGLIRRELRNINYCNSSACFGDTIPESGRIYIESLRSYGLEE